jgi:hypothetical protein
MRGGARRRLLSLVVTAAAALSISLAGGSAAFATILSPITGAVFTSQASGTEVNGNIYASKDDVYLNGGPGAHARPGAAGLPDATYVFMVTDPSSKTLLSQDLAQCRLVTVVGGSFSNVAASDPSCVHAIGTSVSGISVQLMPYADTPNNGGEYKVHVTPVQDYLCAIPETTNCASGTFGFVDSLSKTDNFKVRAPIAPEIDTRFFDSVTGNVLDGLAITWTDTRGASNTKWSYLDTSINVNHEAHVEAPEVGTHTITVANQVGCTVVGPIQVYNTQSGKSYFTSVSGPQDVSIYLSPSMKSGSTIFLFVTCQV